MCGIAGTLKRIDPVCPADVAAVTRMMESLIHRGPDACGMFSDERVVLGHRRLSIIDLSEAGSQPMANEDSTVWTVFNGEIYNYPDLRKDLLRTGHCFRSNSDTEVLLHGYEQWGIEGLLPRLTGMFAFALYDVSRPDNPRFYLVRDRLGIKPLYYSASDERVVFASEVRSLANSGLVRTETNRDALVGFLSQGSVPSPSTWLRDVSCLQPGCYLAVESNKERVVQYWDLSYSPQAGANDTLLLGDAVTSHLLSDVPVGIFLSGGLDSASIVALATRSGSRKISTLTIAFDETEFNEGDVARRLAQRFGTQHREIRITSDIFIENVSNFLKSVDQPTADGINTYFVSLAAKQSGLKVVLSGLGGDEVFLGYQHYRLLTLRSAWVRRFAAMSPTLRSGIARIAIAYGRSLGQERWERFGYCRSYPPGLALYLLRRGFYPERAIADLAGIDVGSVRDTIISAVEYGGGPSHEDLCPAHAFNQIEMRRYLHDQLLRDSDVFSMAHSIELRVPLLDHRLVESVAGRPAVAKVRGSGNKPLLVESVNDDALRAMARSPKRGFTFPLERWIRTHADHLEALSLKGTHVDPSAARRMWSQFRRGRLHWSRVWALVVIEGTGWSLNSL